MQRGKKKTDEYLEETTPAQKAVKGKKKRQENPLSFSPEDILGDYITVEQMALWAVYVGNNVQHRQGRFPISREMVDLRKFTKMFFWPVWEAQKQIVPGSLCRSKKRRSTTMAGEGWVLRDDVSVFVAAIFEALALHTDRKTGLVYVPVSFLTLKTPAIMDFYCTVLSGLEPPVQKRFVFEIKAANDINMTDENCDILHILARLCHSFMVDTGIFKPLSDKWSAFPVFSSGFDFQSVSAKLNQDEVIRLASLYQKVLQQKGVRGHVINVAEKEILSCLVDLGFSYVSGPAVLKEQKIAVPAYRVLFSSLDSSLRSGR